jgi:hypothetical protein
MLGQDFPIGEVMIGKLSKQYVAQRLTEKGRLRRGGNYALRHEGSAPSVEKDCGGQGRARESHHEPEAEGQQDKEEECPTT